MYELTRATHYTFESDWGTITVHRGERVAASLYESLPEAGRDFFEAVGETAPTVFDEPPAADDESADGDEDVA